MCSSQLAAASSGRLRAFPIPGRCAWPGARVQHLLYMLSLLHVDVCTRQNPHCKYLQRQQSIWHCRMRRACRVSRLQSVAVKVAHVCRPPTPVTARTGSAASPTRVTRPTPRGSASSPGSPRRQAPWKVTECGLASYRTSRYSNGKSFSLMTASCRRSSKFMSVGVLGVGQAASGLVAT